MKVILFGLPGAGKGTQAELVSSRLGVPKVSSGDLFRDHQRRNTKLGQMARSYMERGVLVPDVVTIKMVMGWIEDNSGGAGFLLDGFPRTRAQAEALDRALVGDGGLDKAVLIEVSQDELVRRLSGRLVCRDCQTPYHMDSAPPTVACRCDRCGGELYQRDDDKPAAVEERLRTYFKETAPLIDYYREAGILEQVSGEAGVEDVERAVVAAIGR